MKYRITFKDSDAFVEDEENRETSLSELHYKFPKLQAIGAFDYGEYVTIEWDSETNGLRVVTDDEP